MNRSFVLKNVRLFGEENALCSVPYLVVEDGVISFMGDCNPCPNLPLLDGKGDTVLKPFCDYHYHLPGSRLYDLFGINLTRISPSEYEGALRAAVRDFDFVRGFGWDVDSLARFFEEDSRTPLSFLDRISAERPIVLFSTDFHSCWCNSAALRLLEQAGIRCAFADGEIRGGADCILHEKVAEQIFHCPSVSFSADQIQEAILLEQDYLLSLGITEVFSLIFIGTPFFETLEVLRRMDREGLLKIKVHFSYTTSPEEEISSLAENLRQCFLFEGPHLRFASLKVYMDGVVDNHSAFLLSPYSDDSSCGEGIWSEAELSLRVECAASFGLPLHAHAIGDAAAARCARVLGNCAPAERGRHILAHLQVCSEEVMQRMAEKKLVACLQPFWFYRGASALPLDLERLGDRVFGMYPAASLLRHGVKILFASDCPATLNYDPLLGIRTACQSADGEDISFWDGLCAYTVGSYDESMSPVFSVGEKASFLRVEGDLFGREAKVCSVYEDGILLFGEE